MIYTDKVTKRCNLQENDSLSIYDNKWAAQQNYKAFETFFYFLKEVRPSQILDIGTSTGGFTYFLQDTCKILNLDCKILSYDIDTYPYYHEIIESGIDLRVENIFDSDYTKVNQEVIDFIKNEGVTIILCDGGNKKGEFNLLSKFLKKGDFILGHDYAFDEKVFVEKIQNRIWNWHELSESDILDCCVENNLIDYRRDIFENVVWVCKLKTTELNDVKVNLNDPQISNEITFVTGLWNIKRDELSEGWSRSFDHYLNKFDELLKIENNLIIFGDETLEDFVWARRKKHNTQFIIRNLEWIKSATPFEKIQEIRNNTNWLSQSGWLPESTQAKLEYYNPLVMSKMFLLHDAKIMDKFDSEFMFWIDAGITNTVHPGYFTHDKIQNKFSRFFKKFTFICFPYKATSEIHGFSYPKINDYAGEDVSLVGRGGFFGGPKNSISNLNSIYYQLLNTTISDGYMGTEESLFSIMLYRHSDLIDYIEINENGLISKFCEDLKNDNCEIKNTSGHSLSVPFLDINKVALYVITFNSPEQFKTLIESMIAYDDDYIIKTKKFLLDNSSDDSTFEEYSKLCDEFGFEHIKKDNLGICGGRQWIAEHFNDTDLDYYLFFEDDMFFFPNDGSVCRNGFNRYTPKLFSKSLEIMKNESFDFLKLNYSEFFGDNGTQWSWYNVPQDARETFWPEKPKLPIQGLDPNAPRTVYKHILSHEGIPYTKGEIYYSNWPQIVSKLGNKKMFLDTKWAHPYEQTWMSHMFQLTKKNELNPGLLLMTPTEHNRFCHYSSELRKES